MSDSSAAGYHPRPLDTHPVAVAGELDCQLQNFLNVLMLSIERFKLSYMQASFWAGME